MKTTMKTYDELKQQQHDELNSFEGIFFAFSNKQFEKGCKKVGIAEKEAKEKIYSLGGGGFILKTRSADFSALFKRHNKELAEFMKDRKNLLDALVSELCNHEYCITRDPADALEALGLKAEDVPADIMKKARSRTLEVSFA